MTNREVSFLLSMRDEATAKWNQFKGDVTSGSKEAHAAFQNVTKGSDELGKSQNALTGYIKEHRSEVRLQSFVMRESQHLIGAASLGLAALGQVTNSSNEETKRLTHSIQEGFLAFQGFNFVLAGIPGGTAIAAIAGIGAATLGLTEATKDATESRKQFDELLKPADALEAAEAITEIEHSIRSLTAAASQGEMTIAKIFSPAGFRSLLQGIPTAQNTDALHKQAEELRSMIEGYRERHKIEMEENTLLEKGKEIIFAHGDRLQKITIEMERQKKTADDIFATESERIAAAKKYADLKKESDDILGKNDEERLRKEKEAAKQRKEIAEKAAKDFTNAEKFLADVVIATTQDKTKKMILEEQKEYAGRMTELQRILKDEPALWMQTYMAIEAATTTHNAKMKELALTGIVAGPEFSPEEKAKREAELTAIVHELKIGDQRKLLGEELSNIKEWEDRAVEMAQANESVITEIHRVASGVRKEIELKNLQEIFNQGASIALQAADILDQAFSQSSQAEISRIQAQYQKTNQIQDQAKTAELKRIDDKRKADINAIDRRLKSETLSVEARKALELEKFNLENKYSDQRDAVEAKYALAKQKREDEYNAKMSQAKQQAFEQDKAFAITRSIINTALGVTAALTAVPPNPVLAAIYAALGAAETTVIASQEAPAFAQGGSFIVPPGYPNDSYPIRVQSNERVTVETPEQQASAPNRGNVVLTFNFNSPVTDEVMVWNSITKRLRDTGLDITKLAVNQASKVVIQ